ncbi:Uncharacterised protein [Achromobacter xylosoxidans]|nr:Uncharacterised protein [Achromobacter xylosoxidans]
MSRHIRQAAGRQHPQALDPGRLFGAAGGQDERGAGRLPRHAQRDHQGCRDGHQRARQRQFARQHQAGQQRIGRGGIRRARAPFPRTLFPRPLLPRRQLSGGQQQAQRDGQVEAAGLLRNVGRRQIDRDAAGGEIEAAVEDGRAHAFTAFADFGVGQADHVETRQARPQVRLDAHRMGVQATERAAGDYGKGQGGLRGRSKASMPKTKTAADAAVAEMSARITCPGPPGATPAVQPWRTTDRRAPACAPADRPARRTLRG